MNKKNDTKTRSAWRLFVKKEQLTEKQAQQFRTYLDLLVSWNEKKNLTAITQESAILTDHFQDSLRVGNFVDFEPGQTICDVGSGAGFPGIPLAIKYPDLKVILLEVHQKKCNFLLAVINHLDLENCQVNDLDWRTFLRKSPYPVDFFFARASLKVDELMRVFKPIYAYNKSQLVYWASKYWELDTKEEPYFNKEEHYMSGNKSRRLIFFKQKEA